MRIRNVSSLALITFAACCLAPQNHAQQAPVAAAAKVMAQEVVLPVTVRDKKGVLVPGLQPGDFTLTDEGHPQTIKNLVHQPNLPVRLGLLADTGRNLSGGIEGERKGADKFIDLMLSAPDSEGKDEAFLIHYDREVELLADFTSSREKLHRELDQMGSTRRSQSENEGPETTGENRDESRGGRGSAQMYDAIFLAADELMKSKDGRKALVLFSNGVDRGSKETLNEALDAADRAGVAIYTIYYKGEQEHGNNESSYPSGGHRGGGYPGGGGGYPGGGGGYPGGGGGYPNGGGRRGGSAESGVDGRRIMQQIAIRTGGHAYEAKKKDDIEAIYGLIAEELRGQYLLSYTPDNPDNDGSFHKVALKANKSDLSVVTREGYFAPGGDQGR